MIDVSRNNIRSMTKILTAIKRSGRCGSTAMLFCWFLCSIAYGGGGGGAVSTPTFTLPPIKNCPPLLNRASFQPQKGVVNPGKRVMLENVGPKGQKRTTRTEYTRLSTSHSLSTSLPSSKVATHKYERERDTIRVHTGVLMVILMARRAHGHLGAQGSSPLQLWWH